MSRLYAVLALALLLVAPALAQTGSAQFFVPLRDGEASGVAVTVFSEDPDAPTYSAIVGDDGFVEIADVPQGTYYAYAAAESGLLTLFSIPSVVFANTTDTGFAVVTAPDPEAGIVRGRLTDTDTGEPIRFNTLVLSQQGQAPVGAVPALSSIDGNGNYAYQLEPGSYSVAYNVFNNGDTMDLESYRPGLASFTVAAGESITRDLALEPRVPGTVTGTVTAAASGAPVAGAVVQIYAADNTFFAVTVTGPDGAYTADVPENDYIVQVDSRFDGYLPQLFDGALFFEDATPVSVPGDGTASGVDFALVRPADDFAVAFTGRLVDSSGEPVENGTVSVFSQNGPFSSLADVRAADADGTFSVELTEQELAGSRLTLGFQALGFAEEFFDGKPSVLLADYFDIGAEAAAFDVGDVTLLAEGEDVAGFALSGVVTDDASGQPLAGAVVAITRVDAAEPPVYATTDASGAYRADGLDAGEYVVLFTSENHVPEFFPDARRWTSADRVAIGSDLPNVNARMGGLNRPVGAQLKSGSGRLEGAVLGADGEPLAGVLVTARDQTGASIGYALTGATGRYELDGLDTDLVTLSIDRPRYAPADATTSLSGDSRLLVTLAPFVTVGGETPPEASGTGLSVYPNPTRGQATVAYSLDAASDVRVAVYDVLGREVAVVAEGSRAEGRYTAGVDTAQMAPGLYVVRVETASGAQTARFTVVR